MLQEIKFSKVKMWAIEKSITQNEIWDFYVFGEQCSVTLSCLGNKTHQRVQDSNICCSVDNFNRFGLLVCLINQPVLDFRISNPLPSGVRFSVR